MKSNYLKEINNFCNIFVKLLRLICNNFQNTSSMKQINILKNISIVFFLLIILKIPSYSKIHNDDDDNFTYNWYNDKLTLTQIDSILKLGKDIDEKDSDGRTPLMLACKSRYATKEVIEFLISKGSKINLNDKDGFYNPLLYSCINGNFQIVNLLIKNGADVNIKLKNNSTILIHLCTNRGKLNIIELLIKNNVDINALGKNNETALMFAALTMQNEIVDLLIRNGANVNIKNLDGRTALFTSVYLSGAGEFNSETLDLLIKAGANINEQDNNGQSILMLACNKGNYETINNILSRNININLLDTNNRNALFYVITSKNRLIKNDYKPKIIKLLLKEGININQKDKDNNSALDIVKKEGLKEIEEILVKNGAK